MRKARFAFAALAAGLAVACAGTTTSALPAPRAAAPAINADGTTQSYGASAGTAVDASKGGSAEGLNSGVLGVLFQADKVLVLTAQLQFRAADPWGLGDKVQQIALAMSGDVVGVNQSGSGDTKSAIVTIRVPNDRFNTALNQIKAIEGADLQSAQVTGEDKTEQFIDLDARLKAKQDEEGRYLALLAKADTVDNILKIDQVLSNVRAQIEQLQGQLNALKSRSTMATITASLSTAGIVASPLDTGWQPQRTFQTAIAALGALMRVFADVAIWALVWSWVPLLALGALFVLTRRARTA